MRRTSLISIALTAYLLLLSNLSALTELTPDQADAVIQAQIQAQIEQKAERRAELDKATVKSEGRSTLPDGQQIIIREVEPPSNVGASFMTPAVAKPEYKPLTRSDLSPEQLAWMKQQQQIKQHRVLMFSCTVYDHVVTRVSWTHESEQFVAYANADFNLLRGVMNVTTETDAYDFFMGIGDATRIDNSYRNETIPPITAFSPDRSEYILNTGSPENLEATSGLNALLAYYDANLPALKIEFQRREALVAAKKRYDSKHPKELEPFIMQFYIPEKSNGVAAPAVSPSNRSPRSSLNQSLAVE